LAQKKDRGYVWYLFALAGQEQAQQSARQDKLAIMD